MVKATNPARKKPWRRGKQRKNKGAMKKTTKRGAYKKNRKNVMMKRNAPFKETKSRTHEDVRTSYPTLPDRHELVTYDTGTLSLNPDSFLCMTQGLNEDQMIGKSVYSKYINMKIKVRFPQQAFVLDGTNKILPRFPQNYELIWGWIPMPTGFTGNTTPTAPTATLEDVHSHINNRVVDYYNENTDFLRFIPKKSSTVRIIGSRRVRPNLTKYSTAPAQIDSKDDYVGSIPDWTTSISWTTMKKIHYEMTNDIDSNGNVGLYPNYHWLPFCILVNWDYYLVQTTAPGSTEERKLYQPSVAWNDIHYFTDS